jgi:hypothetical protein
VLQLKCDFSLLVLVYDDDDDDHVDGMKLRLWTAVTNGPIVHPPGDVWAWRKTVDDIDWGNPTIRPPERSLSILAAELSSSESGGSGKVNDEFFLQNISFILLEFFNIQ